jgi:acyl carrier protein
MNSTLKDRCSSILRNHFLVDTRMLRNGKYLEDLGLTSPEKKELLNLFEDEFKIELSEKDERKIRTVRDTIFIINQYINPDLRLKTT